MIAAAEGFWGENVTDTNLMRTKADWISRQGTELVDVARFAANVVHQQVLPERVGSGEVGFPAAKLRHFLHEVH